MWFDVEPSDLGFCESSPHRIQKVATLPCDAQSAFRVISSGADLPKWLEDCVGCRWTSAEPYGVGSTRDVELKMLTVRERFLAWEPGVRLAFTVEATTVPLVKRLLEDLQLVEVRPRETRLTWTLHYEPRWFARPIHPVARRVFDGLIGRSAERLPGYIASPR
jgi:hypothetical protein